MSTYIVVTSPNRIAEIGGRAIVSARAEAGLWPINRRTSHRESVRKGDRLLFYVSGRPQEGSAARSFVGSGVAQGAVVEKRNPVNISKEWLGTVSPTRLVLPFELVEWYEPVVPIAPLIPDLQFVKSKRFWGSSMMGGLVKIPDPDLFKVEAAG